MDEQKTKRTRRSPQQRADEMEAKIQKLNQDLEALADKRASANEEFDRKEAVLKARITELEKKKQSLFAPKQPRKTRKSKKQKIQELIKNASKAGLKPEEIAQRLGLDQTEEN